MEYVKIENEGYFKIGNSDTMRPFFMSIISDSNHWMFISSNGGLTAGRKNSEHALFPYYTDDKITEAFDTTGSKSIFQVHRPNGQKVIWEPFSNRYTGVFKTTRNLYKNELGNKVIFEEINHDLDLVYRYQWNSSNTYGFVRKSQLINRSSKSVQVTVLDGIQNIMPYGVPSSTQQAYSNLVDAYKRSELMEDSGLGVFALSAIIVDRAEPSEALKANVVWSMGLMDTTILLSSKQLDDFRNGKSVVAERDVKAERGAYLTVADIELGSQFEKQWVTVADVGKSSAKVVDLSKAIKTNDHLWADLFNDVALGTQNLIRLAQAADGNQLTADQKMNARHCSNVMFNIMRGGIFDDNYRMGKADFTTYLAKANREVFQRNTRQLNDLPDQFTLHDLKASLDQSADPDYKRLCLEYLPLKFSRRHGDPSRPWNRFSINTTTEDGQKVLDYEGNWRDIFQNWEALVHSYPEFITGMIYKFLNATTFDGYNPYRVTKGGFDWETIEPDDPWSYIGYWGDHQLIYLLKFLEFSEHYYSGQLARYFNEKVFVYANVPYRIKEYGAILENPKDTIIFDDRLDAKIRHQRTLIGADGALLRTVEGNIHRVNMMEKLLATILAKVSNFIPEAGIWMNTQRPEWNDANNALVGNGVSMVTLNYLRRFLKFLDQVLDRSPSQEYSISKAVVRFFHSVQTTLVDHLPLLSDNLGNRDRRSVMDGLGTAGSSFRTAIYTSGFTSETDTLATSDIKAFLEVALRYLDHSIAVNKRSDGLYHAYNLMTVEGDGGVAISYLPEMLEGQVAVLSSGRVSPEEALSLLDAMKSSALFRSDQYSYLLYPNKQLPKFKEKNTIPKERARQSDLLKQLVKEGNTHIVEVDLEGGYHFNGDFNNADSLKKALNNLPEERYGPLIEKDRDFLLTLFEEVFDHKSFTGRSGTFFGYEGLGSIYWHMVSKLLLAVQEIGVQAIEAQQDDKLVGRLLDHYYEIQAGIGVHKSPDLYGAFPIDPYSHTPAGKGAQQPGMTGQVKEDILTRLRELGVRVEKGQLAFQPHLVRKSEFLEERSRFLHSDVKGRSVQLELDKDSLAFTYCQVPVIYKRSHGDKSLNVRYSDGKTLTFDNLVLDVKTSTKIFRRTGEVDRLIVSFPK